MSYLPASSATDLATKTDVADVGEELRRVDIRLSERMDILSERMEILSDRMDRLQRLSWVASPP